MRGAGRRGKPAVEASGERAGKAAALTWALGGPGRGREPASRRVARLLSSFVKDCLSKPGMQQLQRDEGGLAFRLLTPARYGFHPRFVTLVRDLLAEDAAAGRLESPVPLEDLAYTAVRVVESYCTGPPSPVKSPTPTAPPAFCTPCSADTPAGHPAGFNGCARSLGRVAVRSPDNVVHVDVGARAAQ